MIYVWYAVALAAAFIAGAASMSALARWLVRTGAMTVTFNEHKRVSYGIDPHSEP